MPMKEWIKYLLLLLTIPFLSLPLSAQELKVRSLELLQDDETVTSEETNARISSMVITPVL